MPPVLAQNQNSGSSHCCTMGSRKTAGDDQENHTERREGELVAIAEMRLHAMEQRDQRRQRRKSTTGTKLEPYFAGHGATQPPRNSSVAMQLTVIMLAYSAMKNEANFMLLYSVWKPATSSFSASGRSNGTRLVSAKRRNHENRGS